jgi:hypothetical protein
VEELILNAAKELQERIPEIVRITQQEITRQWSKPAESNAEMCQPQDMMNQVDGQSNTVMLLNQTQGLEDNGNLTGTQNPESFKNHQPDTGQQGQPLYFPGQPLDLTESSGSANGSNSHSESKLAIFQDVDWYAFDGSLIDLDWQGILNGEDNSFTQ